MPRKKKNKIENILKKEIKINKKAIINIYKYFTILVIVLIIIAGSFYFYLLNEIKDLENFPQYQFTNNTQNILKQHIQFTKKAFDAYILEINHKNNSLIVFVPLYHAKLELTYDKGTIIKQLNFKDAKINKSKTIFASEVLALDDLTDNLKKGQHIIVNQYRETNNQTIIDELYIIDYQEQRIPKIQ